MFSRPGPVGWRETDVHSGTAVYLPRYPHNTPLIRVLLASRLHVLPVLAFAGSEPRDAFFSGRATRDPRNTPCGGRREIDGEAEGSSAR